MKLFPLLSSIALTAAVIIPAGGSVTSNLTVMKTGPVDPPGMQGGFAKYCYTYTVGARGTIYGILNAQCDDNDNWGFLHHMHLDLNKCLANNNGRLVWQADGNAIGSCQNCHSRMFDTKFLDCECRDSAFNWRMTSIFLDNGIRYDMDRHVLACFNNYGERDD